MLVMGVGQLVVSADSQVPFLKNLTQKTWKGTMDLRDSFDQAHFGNRNADSQVVMWEGIIVCMVCGEACIKYKYRHKI